MSIGQNFLASTSLDQLGPSLEQQGLPQPPLELPYPPDAELIPLTPANELNFPPVDLRTMMEQRKTLRRYSEEPLSLDELAALLWLTQGVKRITSRPVTLRTVPSAGARHAFETYLLVNRVTGLAPGIYRYIALRHALVLTDSSGGLDERLALACREQEHVRTSAVTFFWTAVTERMVWRYGERGYRYLLLDAGHVCQNLYLAAEAIGAGVCAIAAYHDQSVNEILGFDGERMFVCYIASLGKRVQT